VRMWGGGLVYIDIDRYVVMYVYIYIYIYMCMY